MASENPKCVGVVFSDRAYKDIQTETYDKDPVETGGILLGHVLSTGHWVVVEVIPPGDNSTHQYAYFEYDEHFVNQVADQIAGKYEQKLELLGLWHRHPGSMDFFSGTDDGTNKKFAEINPAYGAISGLVNIDPRFRMTMYHVDSPLDYTKVETFVGDDIIPAELLKLKEGVTFEDIEAIKKPKTRSEQQPAASQPQTSQQPRQTTPNREEPRRTAQSRENHEKPQVVIQRPETGGEFWKKLILGHPKAFFALVGFMAVFVFVLVFLFYSDKKEDQEYDEKIARLAKCLEKPNKETTSSELQQCIDQLNSAENELKSGSNKKKVKELIGKIEKKMQYVAAEEKQRDITNEKQKITNKFEECNSKQKLEELKNCKDELDNMQLEFEDNNSWKTVKIQGLQDTITKIESETKKQAASKAEQNEYKTNIKPLYDAYEKEKNPNSDKLQSYITKLNNLRPKLKYENNKQTVKEMVDAITTRKGSVKAGEEEKKMEQQREKEAIAGEYTTKLKDEFKNCDEANSVVKVKACLDSLNLLEGELVHEANKDQVKEKQKAMNKKKEGFEKEEKAKACAGFLQKDAYNKASANLKKLKKGTTVKKTEVDNDLAALNELLKDQNLNECETEKNAINKLIDKIDPDKLKDALGEVTKKEQCDKQCESYKVLKTIKDDKYKEVLKKFEEMCKDECNN